MELKEMTNTAVIINSQEEADEFQELRRVGGWETWMPAVSTFPYQRYAGNLKAWASGRCDEWKQITLAQFKERNGIMKYKQGDVLENKFGNAMILGVCGRVYFISNYNNPEKCGNFPRTEKELDNEGYLLKTDEPEMVELTLEDVAKLKGIPVETLRIKD